MSGWRGFAAGAIGLVVVQRLTTTTNAAGAVTGIAGAAAKAVQRFLDPTKPFWSDALIASAAPAAVTTGPGPLSAPGTTAGSAAIPAMRP